MIDFMKFRWLYLAISALVIVPGLISLAMNGLRLGIDFTGGALWEVSGARIPENLSQSEAQAVLGPVWEVEVVQASGDHVYVLRGKAMTPEQHQQALQVVTAGWGPVVEHRFTTVGPVLGQELISKTLVAVALAAGGITLYVWRQFRQLSFGVCAILAMCHDLLVLLGVFSLLGVWWGVEVDVLFVTALLTTLSFSVHDTIVVYDRVREISRQQPRLALKEVLNIAVTQTLGRSINNSMTIIIMLLCLTLLGGESIRYFALALLVGAVTGTYSSTFTAAPLLLAWQTLSRKK